MFILILCKGHFIMKKYNNNQINDIKRRIQVHLG